MAMAEPHFDFPEASVVWLVLWDEVYIRADCQSLLLPFWAVTWRGPEWFGLTLSPIIGMLSPSRAFGVGFILLRLRLKRPHTHHLLHPNR